MNRRSCFKFFFGQRVCRQRRLAPLARETRPRNDKNILSSACCISSTSAVILHTFRFDSHGCNTNAAEDAPATNETGEKNDRSVILYCTIDNWFFDAAVPGSNICLYPAAAADGSKRQQHTTYVHATRHDESIDVSNRCQNFRNACAMVCEQPLNPAPLAGLADTAVKVFCIHFIKME